MFLHRVNNIEHNKKQNTYTGIELISFYICDTVYKNSYLRSDAPSFQRDPFLKSIPEEEDSFFFLFYRSWCL